MPNSTIQRLAAATDCEVRFDNLTRQLYATDASIYQIQPMGVAFPRTAAQAAAAIGAAVAENVAVIPRGAGTGLAGGALGHGLILDCARHNREISDFNPEARTVRVGTGVVLDQLNAFCLPHGLAFGPDVATSSRATLGGMIGNNSSGARCPLYGTTIDHVRALELVLADGRIVRVGREEAALAGLRTEIDALLAPCAEEIRTRFHAEVRKRWPGYGLDRYLRRPGDLTRLLGGSEGTLAAVFSAELELVPLPQEKGIGLIFFASVEEAMQATVELLELEPAAIEHIDDVLFDQTRGQLIFKAARDLLELDTKPCKSILMVEFYSDVADKLAALSRKKLGLRQLICTQPDEIAHVLYLRKSGLTLLTGRAGAAKPTAGVEDAAVPPAKLPEYVAGLREILGGLEASFYGHAATGLLHVRPVVDLHRPEDIQKFRQLADGVSALTKQFRGALASEHGVGIARTEYMPEHLGPLLDVMRQIKQLFDPRGLMNPGKIFHDGRFRIDTNLRQGAGAAITLPFEPVLAFARKDRSFVGNLEQCNGNGECRKQVPSMCPTFLVTGEEIMSTRGRANAIRAALEHRVDDDPLLAEELDTALTYCLSCKACKTECPSNVDLALQKAELLHARQKKYGLSLGTRLMSRPDRLGALATRMPRLANASLRWRWLRALLLRYAGISATRPLPEYALESFDRWFQRRDVPPPPMSIPSIPSRNAARGRVLLWDDCFVRYNDPQIGKAAVRVLEAAGYEVALVKSRVCCGRPAFSTGRLDVARALAESNIQAVDTATPSGEAEAPAPVPLIFLEPSCFSVVRDDYIELGLPGAETLAARAVLFETFLDELLEAEPGALPFTATPRKTALHTHCHTKALGAGASGARLAARIPENTVTPLVTGCCGMAGAYGVMAKTYPLSVQVAEPLLAQVRALEPGTQVVACGTSCRHQLTHLSEAKPLHLAELLAQALENEVV